MRTITRLALTAVIVVGGSAFVITSSLTHAEHHRTVDALVHEGFARWVDEPLKLHGTVVPRSIVEKVIAHEQERTFVLENNGARIRVFSHGPKPDTFKDGAQVMATGQVVPVARLAETAERLGVRSAGSEQVYALDATDLVAKCPEHYDGGEAAPSPLKF